MKNRRIYVLLSLIPVLTIFACHVAKTPPNVEAQARELHKKILTVDTHCDTAFSLLRTDWKIGDRHDPAQRDSGKIDLPRMKEGGLDAEFFAAFVGQGPLTAEGYAKAKESALRAVDAVHKMTENVRLDDRPGRRPGRRPAPQEGRQAHRLHRHGERLSDRPGPRARRSSSTTRASATSRSAIPPTTTSATPRPTAATPRTRA